MPHLLRAEVTVRRSMKVRPDEIVYLPVGNFLAWCRLDFSSFCVLFLPGIANCLIAWSTGFPHVRQQNIAVTERRVESRVALQSYVRCR